MLMIMMEEMAQALVPRTGTKTPVAGKHDVTTNPAPSSTGGGFSPGHPQRSSRISEHHSSCGTVGGGGGDE
jgi:hypothetical protein